MKTNLELYNNMIIQPASQVKAKVKELMKYLPIYQKIIDNCGVKTNMKAFHILIIHYREANNNFSKWLANR